MSEKTTEEKKEDLIDLLRRERTELEAALEATRAELAATKKAPAAPGPAALEAIFAKSQPTPPATLTALLDAQRAAGSVAAIPPPPTNAIAFVQAPLAHQAAWKAAHRAATGRDDLFDSLLRRIPGVTVSDDIYVPGDRPLRPAAPAPAAPANPFAAPASAGRKGR